ncbi:MAG: class I SAM-dependent methyltransferase [Planctomyces sp.]|nr:class I SAM-dependent methyltransferase [Planctomyces sp.]
MKTRDSGMPAQAVWQSFFDPAAVLLALGLTPDCDCVIDLGCGYGTFAIPAARFVRGAVHAIDIDPEMVRETRRNAPPNLQVQQRDFLDSGCGLGAGEADYVMLFNLLHATESERLVAEARRVLRPGGRLGVMHWNYDASTPRGPDLEIRPRPEECRLLVERGGFQVGPLIDLPPHHYGFVGSRVGS